jgi:hypothetical protein
LLLYQRGEAIETVPHGGQAGGEPDPPPGTSSNHPRNAVRVPPINITKAIA